MVTKKAENKTRKTEIGVDELTGVFAIGRDQRSGTTSRRRRHSQVALGVKPHPERCIRSNMGARSRVDLHAHVDGLAVDLRLQTAPNDVVNHYPGCKCGDSDGNRTRMADSEPLDARVTDVDAEVGRLYVELIVLHAHSAVRVHGLQAVDEFRVHLRGGEQVGRIADHGQGRDAGGDDVVVSGLRAS